MESLRQTLHLAPLDWALAPPLDTIALEVLERMKTQ